MVGQQLAEHPAVAHPARDQLRVLPAVVEHDDLLVATAGVAAVALLDRRRGTPWRRELSH